MPLPTTVVDIWRLVYDHNCTSIVMMNDLSEHDQVESETFSSNPGRFCGGVPLLQALLRQFFLVGRDACARW